MPRFKGIGSCHNSGTDNNQGRQRTTRHDRHCFNRNDSHSKSNVLLLLVIYVSTLLNNSDINTYQLSSVRQQSSSSSHKTPSDKR